MTSEVPHTTVRDVLRSIPLSLREPAKIEALTGVRCSVTRQPSGGLRWWLHCPRCGRRCAHVYQLAGNSGCRRCLGLNYRSQRLSRGPRWQYRAKKLFARAGCHVDDSYYYRPKGMHWRTFNQLIDEAEMYEKAAMGLALRGVARMMERYQEQLRRALAAG